MAQAQAAIDLDVRGDNTTFSPYGEAGAQALREAERSVWEDSSKAALAAGVSEQVSPQSLARHQRMGLLSPTSRLQPFGTDRDGSVLGEGASAMAFENAASASKRNVEALGTLPGYAMHYAKDGKVETLKRAITSAMVEALQMAGAGPDDIGVVYANGDGRVPNDEAEALALVEVLGDKIPVTATKAALGNTLAASAPLDGVLALLSLKRRLVPPCCLESADNCLGANLVLKECVPVHKPYALVNVQGQSGQCASILVKASGE
jgi:3-oxoacyl-[acyl-carrier-protein] synthase II